VALMRTLVRDHPVPTVTSAQVDTLLSQPVSRVPEPTSKPTLVVGN
jgi:hypothetical protein